MFPDYFVDTYFPEEYFPGEEGEGGGVGGSDYGTIRNLFYNLRRLFR